MAPVAPPSPTAQAVGRFRHTCPHCGETLVRIPRRLVDRLASLFSPVHRYCCRNHSCRWQGNIAVQDATSANSSRQPRR